MPVASNDVIKATAVMAGPSGAIMNVYEFRVNPVISGNDVTVMTDIAQKLDDAYDLLGITLSSDCIFVEVQGHNKTQNYPMPTVPWPTQTVGQGNTFSEAAQVAALALFRTGVRRVLGRKFIGGLANDALDGNGFMNSADLARVGLFAAAFIGNFVGSTLNGYLPGVTSVGSGLFRSFIEGLARGVPATQRKRRAGRGI